MNEKNELYKFQGNLPIEVFEQHMAMAIQIRAMQGYGYTKPEQAIMALGMGHELGLNKVQVLEYFEPMTIGGRTRITIKPKGALALAHASGKLTDMEIKWDNTPYRSSELGINFPYSKCTVTIERDGKIRHTDWFSLEEAETAGLLKPDGNWIKYTRDMLKWRAVGRVFDVLFLDVIGFGHQWQHDVVEGAYTPVEEETIWQEA